MSEDVTSLKGIYDASIPKEEETESHVDGVHSAKMKDSGSPHLLPLIDCTKVDEDSYFDIIKIKQGGERQKNRPRLGMIRTSKRTTRRFPYHENCLMSIEIPGGELVACLQSIGTVMFLHTWFPTQGDLESYPHIELMSRQHWNPHKIEFPQTEYSVQ